MKPVNGGRQDEMAGNAGWDDWLECHAPKLLLFARQRARCEKDAQELVQDAVVEAWRQQADGVPPSAGLVFAIIHRRAIDLARRNERRLNREMTAHEAAPQEWFAPEIEDRERARMLQDALNRLPGEQRDVVMLKIWGGLTFAEIATALDISANTAASRYRYALKELRKLTKDVFV